MIWMYHWPTRKQQCLSAPTNLISSPLGFVWIWQSPLVLRLEFSCSDCRENECRYFFADRLLARPWSTGGQAKDAGCARGDGSPQRREMCTRHLVVQQARKEAQSVCEYCRIFLKWWGSLTQNRLFILARQQQTVYPGGWLWMASTKQNSKKLKHHIVKYHWEVGGKGFLYYIFTI